MRKNFLFADADEEIILNVINKANIVEFSSKQPIVAENPKSLALILSGKAEARQNGLILRILESGDIFGIAALFSSEKAAVSEIYAKGKTKVAFISEELLLELFKADFSLVSKYISFQADRICYLNQRLSECSGNNTLAKTAAYLYHTAISQNSLSPTLMLNMSQLSSALGIGRASLYRAVNKLEAESIISKRDDEIIINNIHELEKKFKNEEC